MIRSNCVSLVKFVKSPFREYVVAGLVVCSFALSLILPQFRIFLLGVAMVGSVPTFFEGIKSLTSRHISIDVFNSFALGVSFATGNVQSAAFIVLMLTFASVLDWYTRTRSNNAVSELLKLKPLRAFCEKGGKIVEVAVDQVKKGDIVVVKTGEQIPVDGRVVFGRAMVNQSSMSGESVPVEKIIGDDVLGSTINESGVLKIEAMRVGRDSTLERMAALVQEATRNKSKLLKLSDKFAAIFLPIVLLTGLIVYFVTKNITMTAALFLVACADDMAVAIPLAMTVSLGRAAKQGVIVKGGQWFEALSKLKVLVLDKTGTLTYGSLKVQDVFLEKGIDENSFWKLVAVGEKFSEHPVGRAIFREAAGRFEDVPDPDDFQVFTGSGVWIRYKSDEAVIGNLGVLDNKRLKISPKLKKEIEVKLKKLADGTRSVILVFLNNSFAGFVCVADTIRTEASASIKAIKESGVSRVIMFTGDNEKVAQNVSKTLGIDEVRADMKPEDKLVELGRLSSGGPVGMVGDGVNDGPALARADVGIAMGGEGAAVAIEAADIVILTDDLSRLPAVMELGRKTISVIHMDIAIWVATNLVGFALVLTGLAGLSLAAFFNFITDFLPLINSARLYRRR